MIEKEKTNIRRNKKTEQRIASAQDRHSIEFFVPQPNAIMNNVNMKKSKVKIIDS